MRVLTIVLVLWVPASVLLGIAIGKGIAYGEGRWAVPEPPPLLVAACPYCPDSREQIAAARAMGFEVTRTICARCEARLRAAIQAWEAQS